MSPRRARRAPVAAPSTAPGSGAQTEEDFDGVPYVVRTVTGSASTKPYRCPGCDQEIRPATPHVVAWPADVADGLDVRRHWHRTCWAARDRRRAKPLPPRGPRR